MRLEFLGENHFDDVEKFDDVMRIMLAIADGWHDWYWPDPVEFEDALYFQSLSTHFELALKSYAAAAA